MTNICLSTQKPVHRRPLKDLAKSPTEFSAFGAKFLLLELAINPDLELTSVCVSVAVAKVISIIFPIKAPINRMRQFLAVLILVLLRAPMHHCGAICSSALDCKLNGDCVHPNPSGHGPRGPGRCVPCLVSHGGSLNRRYYWLTQCFYVTPFRRILSSF